MVTTGLTSMTLQFDYKGLRKVISGGQTGADQGGLEAARLLGLETGGAAPKGWKTCRGPNPLLAAYGLWCVASDDYNVRTGVNIREGDGTLIIARDLASPGTIFTRNEARRQRKPLFTVDVQEILDEPTGFETHLNEVAIFIVENQIEVLNVAGNRDRGESSSMFEFTKHLLHRVCLVLQDDGLLARKHDTMTA